jgi:hypothetical protein
MKRNIINTSVTDKAKAVYDSLPPHRKGQYVSAAIEEKHSRDTGEVFTPEQQEWIRKEIASFLSGH